MTGFVLRLARESVPLTQTGLAQALGVDVDTLQGWESGRRPLANMRRRGAAGAAPAAARAGRGRGAGAVAGRGDGRGPDHRGRTRG